MSFPRYKVRATAGARRTKAHKKGAITGVDVVEVVTGGFHSCVTLAAAAKLRADLDGALGVVDLAKVRRYERGFSAYFVDAKSCRFRRNTLVEDDQGRWLVVATVGNYRPSINGGAAVRIGVGRYYETKVFLGKASGFYVEAETDAECHTDEEWSIDRLVEESDNDADQMHEANVLYCMRHFEAVHDSGRTALERWAKQQAEYEALAAPLPMEEPS